MHIKKGCSVNKSLKNTTLPHTKDECLQLDIYRKGDETRTYLHRHLPFPFDPFKAELKTA